MGLGIATKPTVGQVVKLQLTLSFPTDETVARLVPAPLWERVAAGKAGRTLGDLKQVHFCYQQRGLLIGKTH